MRLMHTKLPEFIAKLTKAANTVPGKVFTIKGIENVSTTKVQSLATGRITEEVQHLAEMPTVARVAVDLIPQIPETTHAVVIRSYDAEGKPVKAIVNQVTLFHTTTEALLEGFKDWEDHSIPLQFMVPVKKIRLEGYEDVDDLSLPIEAKGGAK